MFPKFLADPMSRKRNAWSYIDARDLGEIVHLCLQKDGLGFQVFNAVNDTITLNTPTREFLAKACPNVKISREMASSSAAIQQEDPRGSWLQGSAQLAKICAESLTPERSAGRQGRRLHFQTASVFTQDRPAKVPSAGRYSQPT